MNDTNRNMNDSTADKTRTPDPQASGSSTNVDTIIGRLVVDQGLATSEEVQLCFEQLRQKEEAKEESLTAALINNQFITPRQADRIRAEAEAQKSTQQIPGYKIKRKLGAGAMASVYLARQLSLDRAVAIKVLPKKFSTNVQFIERFYKEGQAAARLNHPNIVQAFDVGQAGEFHYFVMEYVDGKTVYDVIRKHGKFSEKEATDIILQIADALQHAHERGLIHRDVKPKNIMLTKEGVPKLADMGLARAVSDKEAAEAEKGRAFGTPYYISPEQIRGKVDIGPQADIYALGATYYHMVTGQVPFDGDDPTSVMHKHLKGELIPPDHINPRLSAGVSEIIEMMMARDRAHRYRSCEDVISDLKEVRAGNLPTIAHRELDLSGLATGVPIDPRLEDTAISPAIHQVGNTSLLNNPAFLAILIFLIISVLGNLILILSKIA